VRGFFFDCPNIDLPFAVSKKETAFHAKKNTMKAATINEIKKELQSLELETVNALCLRLAKFKKENKELLSYLLFDAHDEQNYVNEVKFETTEQFDGLSNLNVYYIKKSLRRILRVLNKQIRYSSLPTTELQLRIHYCQLIKQKRIPIARNTLLMNLYKQQLKKIEQALTKLDEDLQFDYESDIKNLCAYSG
jgi:hypothetical protein